MFQHTLRPSSLVVSVFRRYYANKAIYTAQALVKGGRADGRVTSNDGNLKLKLGLPKEMGGPGTHTNPEQLFAAAYAACFANAIGVAAEKYKVHVKSTIINSKVSLMRDDASGKYNIAVVLDIKCEGLDREMSEKVVQRAHHICPYSNATRGNVSFKYKIL
jgi:osmotically inducible protein OsmC